MRTALWLLGVLAVESIIATIVPQEINVPQTVADWRSGASGPGTVVSDAIDLIGAYDVYASPLFLMTLLLLFVSLTGCLLPRIRAWWRISRHNQQGIQLPRYRQGAHQHAVHHRHPVPDERRQSL